MTDNREEPKIVRTRRKTTTTTIKSAPPAQPVVEEEVAVVEAATDDPTDLNDAFQIDAISEDEAIQDAKKAGISPTLTKSILHNRKIIIAFLALLGVLAVFVLGVIVGLNGANMIADNVRDSNNQTSQVEEGTPRGGEDVRYYDNDNERQGDWSEGYKDGFYEGFYNGLNSVFDDANAPTSMP